MNALLKDYEPLTEVDDGYGSHDYRPSSPAGNAEPIHKPDHRAKRHGRPSKWHRLIEAGRTTVELAVVVAFIGAVAVVGMGFST